MGRLATLRPSVARFDLRTAPPPPKRADGELLTAEHRAWRATVIARAGARCEAVDDGIRCGKSAAGHRMFADHILERRDGGGRFDPANGQCLCGSHHTLKTGQARARRLAAADGGDADSFGRPSLL
jgi:5-methylcytosine-specific restriction enzyme A